MGSSTSAFSKSLKLLRLPREEWLKYVYLLNGKDFKDYRKWDKIPLPEIVRLIDTITWFKEQEKKAIEKAN